MAYNFQSNYIHTKLRICVHEANMPLPPPPNPHEGLKQLFHFRTLDILTQRYLIFKLADPYLSLQNQNICEYYSS